MQIELILNRMDQLGWKAGDLAKVADISAPALSRILNGETLNPSGDVIKRLAQALGLSADVLLGLADIKPQTRESSIQPQIIDAYAQLIAEKDKRLEDKENERRELRDTNRRLLRFMAGLMVILIVVLTLVVAVVLFDVTNGNVGFVRY